VVVHRNFYQPNAVLKEMLDATDRIDLRPTKYRNDRRFLDD
jgi:hypothetical protein